MTFARALAIVAISAASALLAPIGVASAAQIAQGGPQNPPAPPPIPPGVIQAINLAGCTPQQIEAAVKQGVTDNPTLAADIAALATSQCPADAAGIAATAAAAAPTQTAAIIVAVILALPPGQQENNALSILVAVQEAVPEAADQITSAITELALNQNTNNGIGSRGNMGPPLVAPQTDVPSSTTQ